MATGTIIRPVDDIDVLAVFSDTGKAHSNGGDSREFLGRIRQAYDWSVTQQVGSWGQVVRLFFQAGGYVDVTPVFFAGGEDYLLPVRDGTWMRTSPLRANTWFAERDGDLSSELKPLVRLLKKWNREHSARLKSFHLETMAATMFSELGSNQRNNLTRFFVSGSRWLSVADPGGQSGDLSSYLTLQARCEVIESFASAHEGAGRALDAEMANDHAQAKSLWANILGEDFPR